MTPALALVLLLVVCSACAYHAAFGRTWRGWGMSVLAALCGFVAGEAVARWLGQGGWAVGQVHALHGLGGAWVALAAAGRWLGAR